MSEQTEKTNPSPRKAPAGKRPPRKTRASGSRSKTAAEKKAGQQKPTEGGSLDKAPQAGKDAAPKVSGSPTSDSKGSGSRGLAPDPATVTFGSNKPIVAAPPPKPVSSGLRFSGPSAGVLKASGPQATSPKADGLTFTSAAADAQTATGAKTTTAVGKDPAKTSGAKAPAEKAADPKKALEKAADAKADTKASEKAKAKSGKTTTEAAKAKDSSTPEPKTAKDKAPQKQPGIGKPGVTKPAIAPQNSGPLIEKTPSRRPALALLGFGCAVAGLAWWLGNQQPPEPRIAGKNSTAVAGAGENATAAPQNGAPALEPSTTPQSQSPAVADSPPAQVTPPGAPQVAVAGNNSVTVAELWEIQDLLRQLDLGPGASSGQMTAATRDAIRSYQEMAGLTVDGEASPALLKELRSVAALYGG